MNKKDFSDLLDAIAALPAIPQKSGVKLKGYKQLRFPEHIWNSKDTWESHILLGGERVKEWSFDRDELLSMATMMVKVDDLDCYFIKNKFAKAWETYNTKKTAAEKLFNDYQGYQYLSITDPTKQYTFDANKISIALFGISKDVFTTSEGPREVDCKMGTIPSVYKTVSYPMQHEYLITPDGEMQLNLAANYRTLRGKMDYEKASRFLRLVYRSLCNYPALQDGQGQELAEDQERAELFLRVVNNQYPEEDKDFKFVMHWCSAIVQNPGINLMTNIWFAGEYQGIGKGTLVNLMKAILGNNKVTGCKANMIKGDFNGPLFGKLILNINEKMAGVTPEEMTNWIKTFAQEPEVMVEKKGQDPISTVNTINIIGTSQSPEDVFKIEDEDRRNVIFRTVALESDPELYWRNYAREFAMGLEDEHAGEDWAAAVAWVLERVVIDWGLLKSAYKTRGYAEVKSTQLAGKNALYLWALDAFPEYARTGAKIKASTMFEDYKNDVPISTVKSQSTFNKLLRQLVGLPEMPVFVMKKPGNVDTAEFDKHDRWEKRD
jgi:hypothetical protein